MAQRLLESGVAAAEGVGLNVSNRYPTPVVAEFGEELSDLIGGRDYLVDVGRNGSASAAATRPRWPTTGATAPTRRSVGSSSAVRIPPAGRTSPPRCGSNPRASRTATRPSSPARTVTERRAPPGVFSPRQARQLILNDPRQPESVRARVRAIDPPEQR